MNNILVSGRFDWVLGSEQIRGGFPARIDMKKKA